MSYNIHKKKSSKREIPECFENEEFDLPLFDSLLNDSRDVGPEAVLDNVKYTSLLTPFEMEWIFGYDVAVPVINLSTSTKREIFYCAMNNGILYDYCTKQMTHLRGHQSKIVSVAIDRRGRWLVTADNGPDKAVIIWDITTSAIVWTIFNHPPKGNDLILVGISRSARLLISISNQDENTIEFWLWTYGNEEPNDKYTDDRSLGAPKAIVFHPNKEGHIMIVFEKEVFFFIWDYEGKKLAKTINPKSPTSGNVGNYTDGTYVDQCHESFVSTSKGCILVYGNTIFAKNYTPEEVDNDKFFIKSIKTSRSPLTCITSVDELIVTGDTTGTIMIFDKRIKLLYWFAKKITKPIKSISFHLNPRMFKFVSGKVNEDVEELEDLIPDCFVDRSVEYETFILEEMPTDATLDVHPFVIRDFFISTLDGTIYLMNFQKRELVPLFPTADSCVAAIDVHEEMPYILVAYTKGRLVLFNYETHEEVLTAFVPETDSDAVISTIKYSSQCLHLACGKSNGELWLLHPAILSQIYVDPFRFGNDRIVKVAFSNTALQMAYYDSNMTVFAFCYDAESEDWIFKGKVRSHYKEICNILFLDEDPYGLYSVGKDRHLIQYTNIAANEEEFDIITRDRIEQKDIPVYFTAYPRRKFSKCGYFLTADDKHKFKTLSSKTAMCTAVYLGPAYGCFKNSPVCKMEFLPNSNKKYIIFMNKNQIGIQLMPIDGNPFKYVGSLAHPEELVDFQMSNNGRYVFTIGKNDRSVVMWKVKPASVETMHILGGLELQPFYCLLEGGRSGFLYQEMRDLFYYMQILQQGEQIPTARVVGNTINLGELPDLMRACGYYPSEYEIENLLTDLRYKDFDDYGTLKDKVTFCEFVKLFINHKPAHGYTIESVENAFETLTTFTDEWGSSDMPREDFIEAITTTGEQVSSEQIYKCLATLLHAEVSQEQVGERDFDFMPDSIDFDFLAEDILGLDTDAIQRVEQEDNQDDDDNYGYYSYYRR